MPSISRLLSSTGEFVRRAQKRYDETDLLMSEILEYGYERSREHAAIERINAIQGHFRSCNDDCLYVLSSFIYEPTPLIVRFGWQPLQEHKRWALFYFWREVGKRMTIRSIPHDYKELSGSVPSTNTAIFSIRSPTSASVPLRGRCLQLGSLGRRARSCNA